jgi:hypothetical protein
MNLNDIRYRLREGQFEFSRHALKRAVERNISDAEIREAGEALDIIEDYPEDKYSPSCLGLGFTRNNRPLHLQVCYSNADIVKIITLYEPNPAEWIEYRIRRTRT